MDCVVTGDVLPALLPLGDEPLDNDCTRLEDVAVDGAAFLLFPNGELEGLNDDRVDCVVTGETLPGLFALGGDADPPVAPLAFPNGEFEGLNDDDGAPFVAPAVVVDDDPLLPYGLNPLDAPATDMEVEPEPFGESLILAASTPFLSPNPAIFARPSIPFDPEGVGDVAPFLERRLGLNPLMIPAFFLASGVARVPLFDDDNPVLDPNFEVL